MEKFLGKPFAGGMDDFPQRANARVLFQLLQGMGSGCHLLQIAFGNTMRLDQCSQVLQRRRQYLFKPGQSRRNNQAGRVIVYEGINRQDRALDQSMNSVSPPP